MKKLYLLGFLFASIIFTGASCIQFGSTAAGPMGMFRSSDAGTSWQEKNILPTAQGVRSISGVSVYRIFTDPGDPNALYLGSRGQGLYYSYNSGESWQLADGTSGKFVYALSVDPRDRCTIFMSDGANIYKTTDCMRSWKTVFTEGRPTQRFVALAVDSGDSNLIYGAQLGGDILRSRDGGSSWRTIKRFELELRHLGADPFNARRIYVASYDSGLFRSDDGGDSWSDLSEGSEDYSDSLSSYRFFFNPGKEDNLFWVSKYGILRSENGGQSWDDISLLTPPGSVNIYGFAVNPSKSQEIYYTGTILGDKNQNVRSTLYKTSDGGGTWVTKKLPTNMIPIDLLVYPKNGNILFAAFTQTYTKN